MAENGNGRFELNGEGDPESTDAKRALFAVLNRELDSAPDAVARTIAAANQEAIMALPAKGRDKLLAIIERRGLGAGMRHECAETNQTRTGSITRHDWLSESFARPGFPSVDYDPEYVRADIVESLIDETENRHGRATFDQVARHPVSG